MGQMYPVEDGPIGERSGMMGLILYLNTIIYRAAIAPGRSI